MKLHLSIILIVYFLLIRIVLISFFGSIPAWLYAEQTLYDEYDVKAAFIYNFAKFIEWPEHAISSQNDSLKLCIIGDNSFSTTFKKIEGKQIKNRRLLIEQIKSVESIKKCNMLYINKSEEKNLLSIINFANKYNVLTISDEAGFEEKGVIINMFISENMIRFNVNMDAAKKAGLKISAKLLKLASNVYGVNEK